MSFLDLLEPQVDKVNLSEMLLVKKNLPEGVTKEDPDRRNSGIPWCMYTDDGEIDLEVFNVLAWVIAKRENHDITQEEVGDMIGLNTPGQMRKIATEIICFYTSATRQEVEERYEAALLEGQEEVIEAETENPTPPVEVENQTS